MRLSFAWLLLFSSCAEPGSFRVVFLSDTHVIGPEYPCCRENSPADNASIVKTVERLGAVRDAVNALEPRPAMVFVLGDVLHAAHASRDPEWYRQTVNAYAIARDLFASFAMPVHLVMGNHDYELGCADPGSFDRAFSEARFQELLGQPPYQAIDHGGWKFLLVNSQRGRTFERGDPACDTTYASVGDEQMAWAEAQLAEGRPTIVMSHYMRILYADVERGGHPSFPALLDASKNVRAFFAGHTHRWLDLTAFNGGVTHWVLGATRYDASNFWVVELGEAGGALRIIDEAKAVLGNSCSALDEPGHSGDCVMGAD